VAEEAGCLVSAWEASCIQDSSNVRKVTGGFLVLCLLLGEESGKSNNVDVDILLTSGA
jgi:hypothetical protein